jgi:3-oxoacyl-[acyl-carrier protein] reductase
MSPAISLNGKVGFVTGATGAIGMAIARHMVQLGAKVVLSDLDRDRAQACANDLSPDGATAWSIPLDVTDPAACTAALEAAAAHFGGLDFLVTSAGVYLDHPIATTNYDEWRRSIAVNLDGVFNTCRVAAALLRDHGCIVNIASMAAHRGSARHADYSAAKGAVLSFTRSLAIELGPRLRVNAVSPGLIDTAMLVPLMRAGGDRLIDATPLKRLGRPEEVATTVSFLCSDWASFISGATIHVNGALYIAG